MSKRKPLGVRLKFSKGKVKASPITGRRLFVSSFKTHLQKASKLGLSGKRLYVLDNFCSRETTKLFKEIFGPNLKLWKGVKPKVLLSKMTLSELSDFLNLTKGARAIPVNQLAQRVASAIKDLKTNQMELEWATREIPMEDADDFRHLACTQLEILKIYLNYALKVLAEEKK